MALCFCAQEEGAFLRIATQRYKPTNPPLRGTVALHPSTAHREQNQRGERKNAREISFRQFQGSRTRLQYAPERKKRECVSSWPRPRRSHRASHAIAAPILVVHALSLCARLVLCITGVLELDLICPCALARLTQFKSFSNTPVIQRTIRMRKQRGRYAHKRFRLQPAPPDVAPVGQCSGSTRLYSARPQT